MSKKSETPTTSSPKSFNPEALRGGTMDDMEIVEQHNLDPKVAYTPAINTAMLDKIERENTEWYLKKGKSEPEAKTLARNARRGAEQDIAKLMSRSGKNS